MVEPADETPTESPGDRVARLVAEYDKFIWQQARVLVCSVAKEAPYRKRYELIEEVAAIIRLQYVMAARTFDESLGWKLSTYANRYAVLAARHFLDGERRRGVHVPHQKSATEPLTPVGSFRTEIDDPPCRPEPESNVPSFFWNHVRLATTKREWSIIKAVYLDGEKCRRVGERMGFSHGYANMVLKQAVRRLRRLYPEWQEYLGGK